MELYGYCIDGTIKLSDIVMSSKMNYNVPNPAKIKLRIEGFEQNNKLKPLKMNRSGVVVDSIISALVAYSKGIEDVPYVYVPNWEHPKPIPYGYTNRTMKFIDSNILSEYKLDGCVSARKKERRELFGTDIEYEDNVRERGAPNSYRKSDPEVIELLDKQDGKCYICGKLLTLNPREKDKYEYASIDHIVPLCKGGLDQIENYGLCCYRCNQLKAHQDLTDELKLKIKEKRNRETRGYR